MAVRSLSRLRLSPHYMPLAKFHASEGLPAKLHLEVPDAVACEEVMQICRHLDLEYEVLPAPPSCRSGQRITIRRGGGDCPDEDQGNPCTGEPDGAVEDDVTFPAPAPGLGRPPKSRRKRTVVEAERLLKVAPHRLAPFYNALVETFPGHHTKLAKLLIVQLRAVGVTAPSSSSSCSSVSLSSGSENGGKRKKKKKKHKTKKAKESRVKKEKRGVQTEERTDVLEKDTRTPSVDRKVPSDEVGHQESQVEANISEQMPAQHVILPDDDDNTCNATADPCNAEVLQAESQSCPQVALQSEISTINVDE